jgi:hypothetical protein
MLPSEPAMRYLRLAPLFCILILSSLPPSKPQQQPKPYFRHSDCAPMPYQCGSFHFDIGYPFSVNGVARPDYCSFPGYRLSCASDGKLVLATTNNDSSASFQVTSVDYDNHLLAVIDQRLADEQACLQPYRNTTIDDVMFEYTDRDLFLTVYINCSARTSQFPFAYDLFSCLSGGRSYYRLENGTVAPDVLGSCNSTLVLPYNSTMTASLDAGNSSLGDAIRGGFTVRWKEGTGWCGDCMNSGGFCGHNISNPGEHTCFCPSGPSIGSCSSSGMFCFFLI